MLRPSTEREALGFSPLVQASWADTSRVECVPLKAACTEPFVPLCAATSRTAGSGCEGRASRDSSLDRARDPKQRRICWGHPRGRTCPILA